MYLSLWCKFSENIIGGDFKYKDFYQSVGKEINQPFEMTIKPSIHEAISRMDKDKMKINLIALRNSFPKDLI